MTKCLEISDAVESGKIISVHAEDIISTNASQDLPRPSNVMDNLLSISAACESYLAKAESSGLIAQKLASSTSSQAPPASKELSHCISHSSLPTSAADASSSALRESLKAVMTERDEARAKLIVPNALHVHEMEQKRKEIEHI